MRQKSTIGTYPKDADLQMTRNFNALELQCKCNFSSCTKSLIDIDHLARLQQLRDMVGPLKITSGYRCKKHNKNVGGVPTSQHVKGSATDVVPRSGLSLYALADLAEKLGFKGIGVYPDQGFVHLDSREGPLRKWEG